MYQSLDFCGFRMALDNAGRANQFSYEAQKMIFEFIEDYERDSGEQVELDVIGVCCDFCEATAEEIQRDYAIEHDADDEGSLENAVRDYLEDKTMVIGEHEIDGITYFIYQQF